MKKILVALTNVDHFEIDNEKTGLWLSEATEFVNAVEAAGYQVDYVSPAGGAVPIDPRSMLENFVTEADLAKYESDDFKVRALTESLKPSDVEPADYVAIYYTGGHGVMWDFPDNAGLQEIAVAVYNNGGYVSSVCHGVAGLFNITLADGTKLIAGKTITGFTDQEETLSGKEGKVPFSNETIAADCGAEFKKADPFHPHVVSDARVITGQNPMSGRAVAEKLLEELQ